MTVAIDLFLRILLYFILFYFILFFFFLCPGEKVYAHKAVLAARCEVMSAMFSGNFKEGGAQQQEVDILETSHDNFLALLEYLYTDHAPIEDGDSVGMLCFFFIIFIWYFLNGFLFLIGFQAHVVKLGCFLE